MLPEEQELNRLENVQAALEDQVASAELNLETLKVESVRFQHHYYQTIGRLYVQLDRLSAQIARAEAGLDPDNDGTQAEIAELLAQKSAEEASMVEKTPPPAKITAELKQAFRQAAKLIHPDRATSNSERERRTVLMALVNVAYARGDQTAIERVIIEFGEDPEAIVGEDVASRLVKTIRRIAQLRRRLNESQQEIAVWKAGELYELMISIKTAQKLGGDPLGELAEHIKRQISGLKVELEMLCQTRVNRDALNNTHFQPVLINQNNV